MSSGVQCSARQCKAASELSGARTKHQRLVGGFISECGSNAASTCSQCIMSRLVMEWDHSSPSAGTICTHMHRPQATCAHKNKHNTQAISVLCAAHKSSTYWLASIRPSRHLRSLRTTLSVTLTLSLTVTLTNTHTLTHTHTHSLT